MPQTMLFGIPAESCRGIAGPPKCSKQWPNIPIIEYWQYGVHYFGYCLRFGYWRDEVQD